MSPRDVVESLVLPIAGVELEGDLALPPAATGLVLFAHGSGSSRHSPRNHVVAAALNRQGLGTLLFDLLTAREEERDAVDARLRFDIPLLAARLAAVTDWVAAAGRPGHGLSLGYFGASTGAAAALVAAAARPDVVRAVVSRGGRPDLARDALARVRAPTLLVVGGDDTIVMRLNDEALSRLTCEKALAIVPDATHLFPEPGAIEQVAALAGEWLTRHLAAAPARGGARRAGG